MCTILAMRRLSHGSMQVLALAHVAARRSGRNVLTPDDLLVSLIQTHDPSTDGLLASMRADDEVRRLAREDSGRLLQSVPPGETKLNADVTRVLRAARREARGLLATQIEPAHLLLGLLRRAELNAARRLAQHGLVYDAVLAALRHSDDGPNGRRDPRRGRPN